MNPLEFIRQHRLVAIVRGLPPEHLLKLGQALAEGGVGLIEVTFDQRDPASWADTARGIETLARALGDRLLVGAGTVIRLEQVRMAYDAGGRYLVTPATQPEIIRAGKALGLGVFPGAFTATEILTAYEAGADAVKVFPAGVAGPGYIQALRAPLGHIPLIAVGGVDERNAADFIRAGCVGVGVGGNLVRKDWIAGGEWGRITELARAFVAAVQPQRGVPV